ARHEPRGGTVAGPKQSPHGSQLDCAHAAARTPGQPGTKAEPAQYHYPEPRPAEREPNPDGSIVRPRAQSCGTSLRSLGATVLRSSAEPVFQIPASAGGGRLCRSSRVS